jgi:hypothetical protein
METPRINGISKKELLIKQILGQDILNQLESYGK